jgi:Leucine-rich repeat (LRR) protein
VSLTFELISRISRMELDCTFSFLDLESSKRNYTCKPNKKTVITQPDSNIRAITGVHEQGKTNTDVLFVLFLYNIVEYVPRGISLFFPNLVTLHINKCDLKQITREDLIGLESLQELRMMNNPLTTLPDDLFINMPKLKRISFKSNKLEYLSSKLLQPILRNGLEVVDFQENTRIDSIFCPGVKRNVKSVEELMQIIDSQCIKPVKVASGTKPKSFKTLPSKRVPISSHQNNFISGFEDLWKSGKFSDFIISVKGSRKIRVHKCVLAMQSLGFTELFDKDESASKMKIEDISADAVEEFLSFLYTGKLSNDTENEMEIFSLASKLKVPELQSLTEKIVLSRLSFKNAYNVFVQGHRYESENLKRAAFQEIKKTFPELSETLIEKPEKLKEIIEAKLKLEAIIQKLN